MTVYITRCPACQQAFKITENVLQAKNGQVRCGFCQNVFKPIIRRKVFFRKLAQQFGLVVQTAAHEEICQIYNGGGL